MGCSELESRYTGTWSCEGVRAQQKRVWSCLSTNTTIWTCIVPPNCPKTFRNAKSCTSRKLYRKWCQIGLKPVTLWEDISKVCTAFRKTEEWDWSEKVSGQPDHPPGCPETFSAAVYRWVFRKAVHTFWICVTAFGPISVDFRYRRLSEHWTPHLSQNPSSYMNTYIYEH